MIRRPPRSTPLYSSAASDVYKRQALSKAEHQRHVMLDEQNADLARQLGQHRKQLIALALGYASGGIIKQQHRRSTGERQCDFEQALLAIGECTRLAHANVGQVESLQQGIGLVN